MHAPLPFPRRFGFPHLLAALAVTALLRHVSFEYVPSGGEPSGTVARTTSGRAPVSQPLAALGSPTEVRGDGVEDLRLDYVDTYAPLAVAEMDAYGIPASVTLAQGILESVAGTSRLAAETNNHFGIKCFSNSCARGHCRNFSDDHHKDFFREYATPAESFRAHSDFLADGTRYRGLFELDADDYRGWAYGLREAGYATDPAYGDKLVGLIERYGLDRFDEARP